MVDVGTLARQRSERRRAGRVVLGDDVALLLARRLAQLVVLPAPQTTRVWRTSDVLAQQLRGYGRGAYITAIIQRKDGGTYYSTANAVHEAK